jgi:Skp family chaperone for outer membrane proteins
MKTMLKLSAAAVLLAATAAPALAAGDVLTVDFNRVFQESNAAKSGTSQLHAKYDTQMQQRATAYQTAVQSFQTLQTQLQAIKAPAKPTEAQVASYRQAGERAQAAQDAASQLDQEVQTVGRYIQSQIVDHVAPIAEAIRAERKADVVVSKNSLLASDPTADITAVVIQRLDTAFPNPSITLPQQTPAAAPAQGPGR